MTKNIQSPLFDRSSACNTINLKSTKLSLQILVLDESIKEMCRQLLMPKPALVLMCTLCPFNNFFLFLWLFQQNPIHPSYHQPGNIQSLGIREFPVMLLVMMVAFFQVQYIVTSDAIIISNFILKTDSILCQSSPRSPSRHDAHCYKDNPHDQTNQHLLAGWSARAGVGHLVTARKGFFLLKEIFVHHLRHVV